jgi:hypothetical protein
MVCRVETPQARSKQIGASSGANQVEIVAVDSIEEKPIRLDVTVALMLPIATQGMIFVARR